LRREYGLHAAEDYYELPLDSAVARGLRRRAGRGELPEWPGLKHLTARESRKYQDFARTVAAGLGTLRVHLDAVLWLEQR
jgi:hypothetical protein